MDNEPNTELLVSAMSKDSSEEREDWVRLSLQCLAPALTATMSRGTHATRSKKRTSNMQEGDAYFGTT